MIGITRIGAGSTAGPGQISLAFRPDIEGLRALAVLLVIAAHAKVPGFAGGFIGVDIFFVLSGYLITGLLCKEVQATGTIKLRAFYARRLQRLMPALLLMVAVTAIASALLLAPFEQAPQAAAGMAATAWLSNFYFAFAHIDYFGAGAETNVFLHTWSLGVEEQFYLAWPVLLLFCLGLLGRRRGSGPNWPQLWQGLLATLVISMALSLIMTIQTPALAFYMAPSRAWQFALGAVVLLAGHFLCRNREARDQRQVPWTLLAWCGLALVLVSASWFDKGMPYPGWRALLPSIGTALILAAGQYAPANFCTYTLSLRPLVGIGRLSYSLYLWHWPALVLGATVFGQSAPARVALVAAAAVLAWLSHRVIETPIRHSLWLRARPGNVLASSCLLIACAALAGIQWQTRTQDWSQDPELLQYMESRGDAPIIYAHNCDEWYHSSRVRACYFGPEDATRTAVLLGDSIGAQWFSAVQGHFNGNDWRILVLTKSACPMVDLPIFYQRIGRRYTECEEWRERALEYLDEVKPEAIILGSSHTYAFSPQEWREGSQRVLEHVAASAGRTYLLQPVPTLTFDAPTCEARQAWRRRHFPQLPDTCTASPANSIMAGVKMALQDSADATGVQMVDLSDHVCPSGVCRGQRNGAAVYRDSQHLTDRFVRSLQQEFDAALRDDRKPRK
ncbi:acyltransferase family protein [Luteimonas sp. MJ174]|uniref:acyltransferase family protein n=1 Tax=Luteimonas sp. MJ174 TaxID=3129237 RepID=UPI0031BBCB3A